MIKVWTHRGFKTYALATDYQIDNRGLYLLDKDDKEIARFHDYLDVANLDLCGDIEIVGINFPNFGE